MESGLECRGWVHNTHPSLLLSAAAQLYWSQLHWKCKLPMKDFQSFCIPLKISLLLENVYVIYAQYSYFNWVISWNLNMWLFPPGFFPFSFKLVTVLLPHFRKIKGVSFSKIKPLEELQIKQQIPCSIWISDKWQIIFTISISHAKSGTYLYLKIILCLSEIQI